MALGLGYLLDSFAADRDAKTFLDWGGADWQVTFPGVAADVNTEMLWILDDIDLTRTLHRAVVAESTSHVLSGITDWELLQFCRNPEWRSRTRFFLSGHSIADPFANMEMCT